MLLDQRGQTRTQPHAVAGVKAREGPGSLTSAHHGVASLSAGRRYSSRVQR